MKKKIFICSPYRGRVEENKKNAVSYARITAMSGDVPIVPHLYFPSFLDDNIPNERMTGIAMGLELMDMCDEVYVFGFDISYCENLFLWMDEQFHECAVKFTDSRRGKADITRTECYSYPVRAVKEL